MCASECRFLTLNLEEKGASSEGGDEGDDVGVLRPEEKWDMNETTRLRPMVRCDVRLGWAGDLGKRRKKNEKVVELSKLRYHELKVDFFFVFSFVVSSGATEWNNR